MIMLRLLKELLLLLSHNGVVAVVVVVVVVGLVVSKISFVAVVQEDYGLGAHYPLICPLAPLF